MLKTRIIPVLLFQENFLVKSINFSKYQATGNPFEQAKRLGQWQVDELIYLDINKDTSQNNIEIGKPDRENNFLSKYDLIKEINKNCFMPLVWGGNIKSILDIENILKNGADKVSINSEAFKNPKLISDAVKIFGSQALIVSIDVKKKENNEYLVYIDSGKTNTNVDLKTYLNFIYNLNVGEILIQNIDRDGSQKGYDLDLIELMLSNSKVPFIACSGVGNYDHILEAAKMGVKALAAANIWHFKEFVDQHIKKLLIENNIDVRK